MSFFHPGQSFIYNCAQGEVLFFFSASLFDKLVILEVLECVDTFFEVLDAKNDPNAMSVFVIHKFWINFYHEFSFRVVAIS